MDLGLPEDVLLEMERTATMSTCEAGRVCYDPDVTGEKLFLLKQGRVQLYQLSPEGKKIVKKTLEPSAIFGEMPLLGQGMYGAFAEAVEECVLCAMSRADVERLILNRPQVALGFVEAMGRRLSELETQLEDVAFKSVPARLAALLLSLARGPDRSVVAGYTHQNLAERLGTHRETTTQTLNEFKRQGLVDLGRQRIVILDRDGLKSVAAEG
ncbi:MAG: Crp/Fnr family transcriptional regulator [Chloroflexi bacterium]|nr:Crp/Fnr family transcriptional regulator [Chloroflexota bacterium]